MKKLFQTGHFKIKSSILFFFFTVSSSLFTLHAQSWSPIGQGMNGPVKAFAIYEGNLIAAGQFDSAGGISAHSIAQWNGVKWDSLKSGMNISGTVSALAVFNDTILYAGGTFNQAGFFSVNNIAKWDGSYWTLMGRGVLGNILAFCIYNGNLILGGDITNAGGNPVNNVAVWNGTFYTTLDHGFNHAVNALIVYNGNLIAGGAFDSAANKVVNNIAQWNGTSWVPIGLGMDGPVTSLGIYDGYLIAGGVFDSAGGKPALNIALWNGSSWSSLGTGIGGSCPSVITYNSELVAGSSVANYIGQWSASSWSNLGFGLDGQANCLTLFNSNLIVGGQFNTAGGNPANNIAQWTGPTGINGVKNTDETANVYPNPCNGVFTIEFKKEEPSAKNIIQIYNMLGERIYSKELVSNNSKSIVEINNQPAGVYLYRVTSEAGNIVTTGKISIQK